jgi:uncharacterized membrane protein
MNRVTTTFLKGLFTLLPLLLSIYLFLRFLNWVESGARSFLLVFWPEFLYIPGLGVFVVVLLIYAFGTVVDHKVSRWVLHLVEGLFSELPVVKTVYMAIKDFTQFLQPGRSRRSDQVVLVKIPGGHVEMIGLMTRDSLRGLPEPINKDERVAVYFPMSYQIGGCTLFIPRAWVHPTTLGVEEAMRSIITAWLPGQDKKLEGI